MRLADYPILDPGISEALDANKDESERARKQLEKLMGRMDLDFVLRDQLQQRIDQERYGTFTEIDFPKTLTIWSRLRGLFCR